MQEWAWVNFCTCSVGHVFETYGTAFGTDLSHIRMDCKANSIECVSQIFW
jgi:hypothetical protein